MIYFFLVEYPELIYYFHSPFMIIFSKKNMKEKIQIFNHLLQIIIILIMEPYYSIIQPSSARLRLHRTAARLWTCRPTMQSPERCIRAIFCITVFLCRKKLEKSQLANLYANPIIYCLSIPQKTHYVKNFNFSIWVKKPFHFSYLFYKFYFSKLQAEVLSIVIH